MADDSDNGFSFGSLIAPLISGLAGLFGGGQQKKVKTSGTISNTENTQQQQQGTNISQNVHNLSPIQQQLIGQFTKGASDLYNTSTDLSGYKQQGLKNINTGSDLASKVIQNSLASRGLSYSPAAATATTQNELNRVGQGSTFLSQVPLLQRQLQSGSLNQLMQAFGILPTDTTTSQASSISGTSGGSSTQTQQGTNLTSGNPLGGLTSGISQGLFAPINPQGDTNLSAILKLFGGGGFNPPIDQNVATHP